MATVHIGGQPIPGTFTNHFLAHLQAAAAQRFATGKGFFLTTTGEGDDEAVTASRWLHPAIGLTFSYDLTDGSGARVPPVALDHNEIDALAAAMNQPNGVRGSDGVWWPFAENL